MTTLISSPSNQPGRKRLCNLTGKRRFRDHLEAVEFLHRGERARALAKEATSSTTHRAIRSYECSECSGWHVTSWRDAGRP